MGYRIVYTKHAEKDARKLEQANLKNKAISLLKIIKENPYQNPPPYEKLIGDLKWMYSRRISIQHRIVYLVDEDMGIVKIIKLWTHYE
ncbi:MAG: Txe/YoeB family addiction module toxin [Paenibacillaceae bacterium]